MTTHECGLEVTYCDECGAELEEGQVGKCEDCAEYTFDDLSDTTKETARDNFRGRDYPHDDWWDNVYEDAVRVAVILGIEISTSTVKLYGGSTRQDPDISFSGFCSQGDGASFEGSYSYEPEAIAKMEAYCNDEELIRIAKELTLLQITRRLLSLDPFNATIGQSGNYSHSGTMRVTLSYDEDENGETSYNDTLEDTVTQLFRDFADWIYRTLETEHDWLCADEQVDYYLADETFDVDGNTI